jgi:hypothetical protein
MFWRRRESWMAGVMPCSTQVGQHQGSVVGTSLRGGCRQSACQPASGATVAHQHGLFALGRAAGVAGGIVAQGGLDGEVDVGQVARGAVGGSSRCCLSGGRHQGQLPRSCRSSRCSSSNSSRHGRVVQQLHGQRRQHQGGPAVQWLPAGKELAGGVKADLLGKHCSESAA